MQFKEGGSVNKWDHRLMDLAKLIASWSKDPSTKNGAVIADKNNRVISVGFNGFPHGIDDKDEYLNDRAEKYPRVLHAELNSILFSNINTKGMRMYCTGFPCTQCAAAIIQSGIKKVISIKPKKDFSERWQNDIAYEMLIEAGVEILYMEE